MKGLVHFHINLQYGTSGGQYFTAAQKQHAVLKGQVLQHKQTKWPPVAT
jgi:hypothetical protein